MIRKISGVIAGYLIFAVSAVLLFQISGQNPHGETSASFAVFVILYGAIFSIIGGFIAKAIAGDKKLLTNYILAAIIAGFATFSLFATGGNHYTQIAAVFLFAPLSIWGGFLYLERNRQLI